MRAGKVRAVGASNFPAWLLSYAVAVQEHEGWARFAALQPQYSLVERSVEAEILPFCRWAGLGVLPWGPLGAGFLTGRYARDAAPPPGSRMDGAADDLEEAPARRAVERNFRAVDAAREVAAELGATVSQVAVAWLLHQPGVTAPIVGPRTPEQLDELLGASDLALDDDQLARLSAPTAPPERYPDRMLAEQVDLDVERQATRARPLAGAERDEADPMTLAGVSAAAHRIEVVVRLRGRRPRPDVAGRRRSAWTSAAATRACSCSASRSSGSSPTTVAAGSPAGGTACPAGLTGRPRRRRPAPPVGRRPRRLNGACQPSRHLQEILQRAGIALVASTPAAPSRPASGWVERGNRCAGHGLPAPGRTVASCDGGPYRP